MSKLAFLVVLVAGCSEPVHVNVKCLTTAEPAVECDVHQTEGKSEVEACWEFQLTCGNGEIVKAPRTCQKVKDGGSVKTKIAGSTLTNLDKCGGTAPPKGELLNMTLNGKPSEL
ncbi:MAG: hypothetical protein ABI867_03270 [Kofleriaceae bacterium]